MSRSVRLKAPVNSLSSAKIQIACGADEIYLGMFSPKWFHNLSFSHRGRTNLKSDQNGCLESYDDLKEIVDYAHQHGVTVSFTANLFNMPDTPNNPLTDQTLVEGYLDYIGRAIDCGIDSVIVATLGEVIHIRNRFPDVKIVASCLFMISNTYYYDLLRDLGVTAFFLPHDSSISEMRAICERAASESERIEVGVFSHLSCAMLSGGCHWYHKFGEAIDLGYPCRNKYIVTDADGNSQEATIFDFNCDCSICQVEEMVKAGVTAFKLVGRSSSPKLTSRMTTVYSQLIDAALNGEDTKQIRDEWVASEKWWEYLYCRKHACKYSDNGKFKDYLIG